MANWGIISSESDTTDVEPLLNSIKEDGGNITGVFSENPFGEDAIEKFEIGQTFDSIDQIIGSNSINVILIRPTSVSQHVQWTKQIVEAGKHMISTIPIGSGFIYAQFEDICVTCEKKGIVLSSLSYAYMETAPSLNLVTDETALLIGALPSDAETPGFLTLRTNTSISNTVKLAHSAASQSLTSDSYSAHFERLKRTKQIMDCLWEDATQETNQFGAKKITFVRGKPRVSNRKAPSKEQKESQYSVIRYILSILRTNPVWSYIEEILNDNEVVENLIDCFKGRLYDFLFTALVIYFAHFISRIQVFGVGEKIKNVCYLFLDPGNLAEEEEDD